MEQPQIHLYHGDGKGKTTAAIGLAVRCAGAGGQVIFAQFMKGRDSSELNILKEVPQIHLIRVGKECGFSWQMSEDVKKELTQIHTQMLQEIRNLVKQKSIDLIVLDEVVSAYRLGFLPQQEVLDLLNEKPAEIVLTGRDPADELIAQADYLTEMRMGAHPYTKGLAARKGIEW
ncbi:MAG: cob(I)yrinic acid a,c-diamide adenosyltransferase [Lachnospiraceae bacterium]|nr:cob(I)yrinic acid a,c-diamide adenosyltransferase [Lachnospiraceae bacterium]